MSSQPSDRAADRPILYVTEFLHRVHNEYTCAISLATRLAARSSNEETKAALAQVIDQLYALASAHEILRPPLTTALVDLSANMTQLCRAMTSSSLAQRGIELNLAITDPVLLDAKRCWRAELIISELITNASRHAFVSQAGRISVAVKTAAGWVICRVSDDGSHTATLKRGLGTELIEALAADLDGYVERLHKASGTTVTLCFPRAPAEGSTASEGRRGPRCQSPSADRV
ncbi:MAG TPA: sensor histidine kinase [Xanthobacteraceae bacterium]|jgi:two-component sensor histidine kinase|nr:sensor histidine kinase [Xanthobacteraceae bacterium]